MQVDRVNMSPNGPELSSFAQGYWRMAEWGRNAQAHLRFISQHVELGITTVDHAHVYGNPSCEAMFGDALKLNLSLRDNLQIVTKCGIDIVGGSGGAQKVNHYNTSKEAITASVNQSLARLGIDCIDVLLIHRPDFLLDISEVASAFETLKAAGKVKFFGVSNFNAVQYAALQSALDVSLVTNQVEINPVNMKAIEDGTLDHLQSVRVRPMAWSCLAGGMLFNELASGQVGQLREVLSIVAKELNAQSIDQVLFAWVLRLPSKPIPIIGSGKIDRIRVAIDALNMDMSREQWYRIWVAAKGHGVP